MEKVFPDFLRLLRAAEMKEYILIIIERYWLWLTIFR